MLSKSVNEKATTMHFENANLKFIVLVPQGAHFKAFCIAETKQGVDFKLTVRNWLEANLAILKVKELLGETTDAKKLIQFIENLFAPEEKVFKNIRKHINEYGFKELQMFPEQGGTFTIVRFNENDPKEDLGCNSVMNPNGIGGSNYIGANNPVAKLYSEISDYVWLNAVEKAEAKKFIKENFPA